MSFYSFYTFVFPYGDGGAGSSLALYRGGNSGFLNDVCYLNLCNFIVFFYSSRVYGTCESVGVRMPAIFLQSIKYCHVVSYWQLLTDVLFWAVCQLISTHGLSLFRCFRVSDSRCVELVVNSGLFVFSRFQLNKKTFQNQTVFCSVFARLVRCLICEDINNMTATWIWEVVLWRASRFLKANEYVLCWVCSGAQLF